MGLRLVWLEGERAGDVLDLEGDSLAIGRDPTAALVVPSHLTMVSSKHAMIVRGEAGHELWDLSKGGTFVAGERISRHTLADGDVIQLGPGGPRLGVRLDASAASAPAARALPAPASTPPTRRRWLWLAVFGVIAIGAAVSVTVIVLSRSPTATPDTVTGKVVLPPGVSAAGLRVLAPTESAALGRAGGVRVRAPKLGAERPFLAAATAAGQPILLGEAGGELSARTTALALVLLDPELARRGAGWRARVRDRAEADPRFAALTRWWRTRSAQGPPILSSAREEKRSSSSRARSPVTRSPARRARRSTPRSRRARRPGSSSTSVGVRPSSFPTAARSPRTTIGWSSSRTTPATRPTRSWWSTGPSVSTAPR